MSSDEKNVTVPLFEAQLILEVPDMVFIPSLAFGESENFFDLVESLISDVFRVSSLVPRLSQHSSFPHYQVIDVS